jgi:uncharacterized membrane protein (UPF0127 family)
VRSDGEVAETISLHLRRLGALAAAFATLLAVAACPHRTTSSQETATTTTAPNAPHIVLPDGFSVSVEVAADDPTREQGLMYRDQLAADRGMIFVFAESGVYPFWMKNTLIPLDMIWIDEGQHVVTAMYGVPPCKADPCPSYPPTGKAKYVLELASGVGRTHKVVNGSQLRFVGLDHVVVR